MNILAYHDRVSPTPEPSGDMPADPSRRVTVLVVDDDRDAADTIAMLLEATGLVAIPAYSARDGLDRLDECADIALVISDIRMPGVDGFDFLRVVKHRFPALPTVLTTGFPITDEDVVPRGALILQKPFAPEELQRAVAAQLRLDVGGRSSSP